MPSATSSPTKDATEVKPVHASTSPTRVRLRIFYEFERPRNGRELQLDVTSCIDGHPSVPASQLHTAVAETMDMNRFVPHVYDGSADCFVPVKLDSDRTFLSEPPAEGTAAPALHRIDVKLVPLRDPGHGVGGLAERMICDSSATSLTGTWFGIGIVRGKTASNHGSLWRSALQFGAALTFTIGQRYEKKVEGSADIYKTCRQVPCLAYADVGAFMASAPVDTQIVAVEYGGTNLTEFKHPKRALYVLGSEDAGMPPALVQHAHEHVAIPTAEGRPSSLNVAAAGAIIMYDRQTKMMAAKREREKGVKGGD